MQVDTKLDSLIRFTVTPILAPGGASTTGLLGVLLSGDIVEGKDPICYNALGALGNGFTGT